MSQENGIAKAEDFRKLVSEDEAYEPPERIILPASGLAIIVRRPKPLAYTLLGIALPASLVYEDEAPPEPAADPAARPEIAADDMVKISRWTVRLMQKIFVKPRLALAPGPEEISPLWIPAEDQKFILAWTRGEVTSAGESLRGFRDDAPGGAAAAR